MKPSEATQLIAEYKERYFTDILNIPCILSFDVHTLRGIIIKDVYLAKVTGMKNTPDKRVSEGKQYTPRLMHIETNDGNLFFVLEDIKLAIITDGIRLTIGENKVEIRKS